MMMMMMMMIMIMVFAFWASSFHGQKRCRSGLCFFYGFQTQTVGIGQSNGEPAEISRSKDKTPTVLSIL